MTGYTAAYDIPPIKRGDTMDPFKLTLKNSEDEVVIPAAICCQVRDERGRLIITLPTDTDSSTGVVTIGGLHASVTAKLKAGDYTYDVEYTSPEGRVRTYLEGSFTVIEDVSRCL